MEPSFWQQRWESNNINFHNPEANALLVKHFSALSVAKGDRIFVPLCGKTLDIAWLLAQGYRVAGAELVEMAVQQLFDELGVTPQVVELSQIKHYSAENIDIFVGNIFDLTAEQLGPVDAVYDRAALVALPAEMRQRYTAHLMEITELAPQLLIAFDYDQSAMPGPPFSISAAEVKQHYSDRYNLSLLLNQKIKGGLKGKCEATRNVWLLKSHIL